MKGSERDSGKEKWHSKRFQWTVIYNRLPGTMDITEPGQKWMGQDLALECRFYELDLLWIKLLLKMAYRTCPHTQIAIARALANLLRLYLSTKYPTTTSN